MSRFYERRETAEQIEFEFRYMPWASLVFFLAIGASLSPVGRCTGRLIRICAVLFVVWMIGLLPAWIELEKAMRRGLVTVTGSKFSTKNPLKVVIAKS